MNIINNQFYIIGNVVGRSPASFSDTNGKTYYVLILKVEDIYADKDSGIAKKEFEIPVRIFDDGLKLYDSITPEIKVEISGYLKPEYDEKHEYYVQKVDESNIKLTREMPTRIGCEKIKIEVYAGLILVGTKIKFLSAEETK